MIQRNLGTKQKETLRVQEPTYGCRQREDGAKGTVRELGMDVYTWFYLKWRTRKDLLFPVPQVPQGTLLSVMWQPGWEGSLREIRCMCVCGWVPLLVIWNDHNIVNRLCTNTKFKIKKKKEFQSPSSPWVDPPAWTRISSDKGDT